MQTADMVDQFLVMGTYLFAIHRLELVAWLDAITIGRASWTYTHNLIIEIISLAFAGSAEYSSSSPSSGQRWR
jgi:hypothetical protein